MEVTIKEDIENMTPQQVKSNNTPLGSILSPIKRGLSPQRDPQNVEIRKFERSINDLTIANSELIKLRDSLEGDLKTKSTQLKNKNIKISELIQENTHLVKELQRERDCNEEDFTNWTEKKYELEGKIRTLNDILLKRIQNDELESTKEINHSDSIEQQIQSLKFENEKLSKRVNTLERDNELEVQSKMLIIDELETLKSNFSDLSEDYEQVKLDYDELVTEYSLNQVIENDDITTPTLEASSVFKLENPKIRHISSSSSITISPGGKRNLSRAIRDTEIQSQKAKYSQIIMNYEFTIKSLTLQTEKLISYIGYIEQQIDGQEGIEYSDDINIKNAKKSIKSIMRSVSTIGLTTKPGDIDRDLKFLDLDIGSGIQLGRNDDNGSFNESFCESLAYSTDYNKGNVTNLEVGSDFSFNDIEDGDDELEDEEINEDDSMIITKPMHRFSSTDSLNVSYKMDFQPKLKSRKSKMLKEPSRTHVIRMTKLPSEMDIRGHNFQGDEYYSTEQRLSNKSSLKVLTNSQLIHSINEEQTDGGNMESFKIMGDDEIGTNESGFAFPHISEGDEEFDDILQVSSEEDEEDEEEETGVIISNKELDEFKMVWRSGFCAKHSLLLCLCHQRGLVNNLMLQFAMNPIYKLRRGANGSGSRRQGGVPLRYQKRVVGDGLIPLMDMQIVD